MVMRRTLGGLVLACGLVGVSACGSQQVQSVKAVARQDAPSCSPTSAIHLSQMETIASETDQATLEVETKAPAGAGAFSGDDPRDFQEISTGSALVGANVFVGRQFLHASDVVKVWVSYGSFSDVGFGAQDNGRYSAATPTYNVYIVGYDVTAGQSLGFTALGPNCED